MEKAELKPETATQKFYKEVAELKPRLPDNWKLKFWAMHPEYDTYRGGVLINNVLKGCSTDPVILEGMKKIIEEFEASK